VDTTNTTATGTNPEKTKKTDAVKEFLRKFVVSLKRRPQIVATVLYVIALVCYTLNLTAVSNTTAYIQKTPMGLCAFVAVLFSILGIVCMINVYPKRQKTNYVMLTLFFLMAAVIVTVDFMYRAKLIEGINAHYATFTTKEQISEFQAKYSYCFKVKSMLIVHVILVLLSSVLFAASPLIGKALKKIDTSVKIEYNSENMIIEREDD